MRRRERMVRVIVTTGFVVALGATALAKPAFMDRFNRDPFARAELHNQCTVCHVGRAGGPRTNFGEAFGDAGFRITPKLRSKFPEIFDLTKPPADPTKP